MLYKAPLKLSVQGKVQNKCTKFFNVYAFKVDFLEASQCYHSSILFQGGADARISRILRDGNATFDLLSYKKTNK